MGKDSISDFTFQILDSGYNSAFGLSGDRGRKRKAIPGRVQIPLDLKSRGLEEPGLADPMAGGGIG